MALTNLVPTAKTCERLKQLGWKKETAITISTYSVCSLRSGWSSDDWEHYHNKEKTLFYAPTSSELGEVLGRHVNVIRYQDHNRWGFKDSTRYYDQAIWETESEIRAILLIWLTEKKHIKL